MTRTRAPALVMALVAVSCVAVVAHLRLRDPLAPVMSAANRVPTRPIEARLTGFSHGARPSSPRGDPGPDLAAMRLQDAASRVAVRLGESHDPRRLHGSGVALLIRGDGDAVEKLRESTERAPDEPRYWSDLAAAFHARAIAQSNPHDFAHALAAADRALRLAPAGAEALFNRALILEGMRLKEHAATAWDAYLRVDSTSRWAEEARRRAEGLRARVRQSPAVAAILREPRRGDEAILSPLVSADPGMTRRIAETVLLANWGRAVERGSFPEAEAWLADARTIGRLLHASKGERMVVDAVAAIDACATRECTADLAEGHRRYDDAKRMYARQRLVMKSLPEFRHSARLFRKRGSPMALVADYSAANCLEDASDPSAVVELERLLGLAPDHYPALRAQLQWELGTNSARVGKTPAAFVLYSRALEGFSRLGEEAHAARMRDGLAAVASLLGRRTEAWRLRVAANASLSESGAAGDVHRSLELAGRMEAVEEHWEEASSLFALAIAERSKHGARTEVSAMLWRALAMSRAGLPDEARWQLGEARRFAWSIADDVLRESALEDLTFADAVVIRDSEPARSAAILDRYLASSERRARTFHRADAQLERARAARALGHADDAERFYRSSVTTIDAQRRDAHDRGIVDAYFATATAASNELADLLESRLRPTEAFATLESGRGRILLERLADPSTTGQPLTPDLIRAQLGDRTIVISYLLLRDRMLIFALSRREGLHVTRTQVRLTDLQDAIRRLRTAIDRDDAAAADSAARFLYGVFVAPLHGPIDTADTLVIVPDPAMAMMPFAALRDPEGTRVIERFALTFAPSASVFARAAMRPPGQGAGVIALGNPAFDAERHPSLEPLRAAEREAADVASRYPGAKVATGAAATSTRFLELLPDARVVHLATHAVTNPHDPMSSVFLFAPDGARSGDVRADEIVRASCRADVVVLAACQTSFPAETPSDIGTLSLAFLAAGARNVVGTLWNVDDEDAAAFSRRLHVELRAGTPPAEAVRRAQRDLLHTRPVRAWAAFTITGAGT